ncbi:hypothetical protein [Croceicoccus naphthovorans]|uniref:Uncharacterized protein n=1 Tax=Croceicoccus naphthovorans TaxID=1348774 RepID=A0A0G3XBL9_9SPHN|nr:hypothetical protein [Croceicoccus naphthovorans]AKM08960.1 hypothetical protein AB433_01590 [Croceicoccus naphthovorans]MBB3989243.1 hypothetical protein [Croceicoccus naphthovorans]
MHTYQLRLSDDDRGIARTIEFEAADTAGALNILGNVEPGRRAELWEAENYICSLSRDGDSGGLWNINT